IDAYEPSTIVKVARRRGGVACLRQGIGRVLAGSPASIQCPRMARWTFGDFVLDLDTRELARAGTPVSLSPKAFQLLGILVDSCPAALSKNELQDRLWPGTIVVEKNLTNLV